MLRSFPLSGLHSLPVSPGGRGQPLPHEPCCSGQQDAAISGLHHPLRALPRLPMARAVGLACARSSPHHCSARPEPEMPFGRQPVTGAPSAPTGALATLPASPCEGSLWGLPAVRASSAAHGCPLLCRRRFASWPGHTREANALPCSSATQSSSEVQCLEAARAWVS